MAGQSVPDTQDTLSRDNGTGHLFSIGVPVPVPRAGKEKKCPGEARG